MADGAGNPSKGVIRQEQDFEVRRTDTHFKSLANIVEIFLGNPEIETNIPAVLLLRALVYANQPIEERLRILESFGIKTRVLRKDLEAMDSLWDNVAKMNFSKGEKQGITLGENKILDQINNERKQISEGKITKQEFADWVISFCEEKNKES